MTQHTKCTSCQTEIPVGKYYELYKEKDKIGDYCSPCWTKEQIGYEDQIKKGLLKVIEAERERERETKLFVRDVKREILSIK